MSVIIKTLDKPKDCTECPVCNEYDECMLSPISNPTWDEQYKACPMEQICETEDEA